MSAPNTNIEKQKQRHRGPLIGIAAVTVFAVLMIVYWLMGEAAQSNPPSQDAAISAPPSATLPGATPPEVITPAPGPTPTAPAN